MTQRSCTSILVVSAGLVWIYASIGRIIVALQSLLDDLLRGLTFHETRWMMGKVANRLTVD